MISASVAVPMIYGIVPVWALGVAVIKSRRTGSGDSLRAVLVVFMLGGVAGLAVAAVYRRMLGGGLPVGQVLLTCYGGVAVASVVSGANAALRFILSRLLAPPNASSPTRLWRVRGAAIVQSFILVVLLFGYGGSMLLLYRPRVVNAGDPKTILAVDFQRITFTTSDGIRIAGWWIAAPQAATSRIDGGQPHDRTIILCHALGADKANALRIVRDLPAGGFNVLAFDFRGHGQSGGVFSTLGDLERLDVLGAVTWVRKTHRERSKKIFGVGEGMGAAALIAAAADPDQGQAIDALALFAPYDRLDHLLQNGADRNFVPAVGWIERNLALPAARMQMGRIGDFAPADLIDKIAPRPILVIGAEHDQWFDVSLSHDLYEQASQPKYAFWIRQGRRQSMLFKDRRASMALRTFLEIAQPVL